MLLVWSKAVIVEPVTNIICSIVMDSFFDRDTDEEEEDDEHPDEMEQQRNRQWEEKSRGKRPASGRYVIGYWFGQW